MGSEMCIRDRVDLAHLARHGLGRAVHDHRRLERHTTHGNSRGGVCLLYTSDAADERSSVDLGGRRIIKKKKHETVAGDQRVTMNNARAHRDRQVGRKHDTKA